MHFDQAYALLPETLNYAELYKLINSRWLDFCYQLKYKKACISKIKLQQYLDTRGNADLPACQYEW